MVIPAGITVGATLAVAPDDNASVAPIAVAQNYNGEIQNGKRARVNRAPTTNATIGDIVGAYKSLVTNECLKIYKTKNETMGKLWQRNYYEHIIRNEKSYHNISDYIINNPANWKDDNFFSE